MEMEYVLGIDKQFGESLSLPSNVKVVSPGVFADIGLSSLSLNQGLEYIGDYAFYKNALTNFDIPSSVVAIGNSAFAESPLLTTVGIAQGVETIGKAAFKNTDLRSITIPPSVKVIDDMAFSEISRLAYVTLNNGLETIGEEAFSHTRIGSVTIPSTVTNIGEAAFSNNSTYLASIHVAQGNENFVILSDCLYTTDMTRLIWVGPANYAPTFTLPEPLTKIERYLFAANLNIKTIVLNDSLETIENRAFLNASLENIEWNDNLKTIKDYAFSRTALTNFLLPDSVHTLGYDVVASCSSLKTIRIGHGIDFLNGTSFINVTNCTTFIISSSLSGFDDDYFSEGHKFTEIRFEGSTDELLEKSYIDTFKGFATNQTIVCDNGSV
jgi:hypothetical protein